MLLSRASLPYATMGEYAHIVRAGVLVYHVYACHAVKIHAVHSGTNNTDMECGRPSEQSTPRMYRIEALRGHPASSRVFVAGCRTGEPLTHAGTRMVARGHTYPRHAWIQNAQDTLTRGAHARLAHTRSGARPASPPSATAQRQMPRSRRRPAPLQLGQLVHRAPLLQAVGWWCGRVCERRAGRPRLGGRGAKRT